jgi:hypothetical protein
VETKQQGQQVRSSSRSADSSREIEYELPPSTWLCTECDRVLPKTPYVPTVRCLDCRIEFENRFCLPIGAEVLVGRTAESAPLGLCKVTDCTGPSEITVRTADGQVRQVALAQCIHVHPCTKADLTPGQGVYARELGLGPWYFTYVVRLRPDDKVEVKADGDSFQSNFFNHRMPRSELRIAAESAKRRQKPRVRWGTSVDWHETTVNGFFVLVALLIGYIGLSILFKF